MIKKMRTYLILALLNIFIICGLFVFAQMRFQEQEVENMHFKISHSEQPFVSEKMLIKLLKTYIKNSAKIFVKAVDLNELEEVLTHHNSIEQADVFWGIDGALNVQVKQRLVLARVMDGFSTYYIDNKGDKMELSEEFSAQVPVVFGEVSRVDRQKLLELLKEIYEDEFLKQQVTEVLILNNQKIEMKVRDGDYVVKFGVLDHIYQKLQNYKAFKSYSKQHIERKYQIINISFTKQVICS